MDITSFIVPHNAAIRLRDFDPAFTGKYNDKREATEKLKDDIKKLVKLQDKLYAMDRHALLIIFQAMDAAGKDGTIKHVMSGINPQGCQVFSFKKPSAEELDHDYLWRCAKSMPERGRIGIFNRSYYEEVLVARVHPEIMHAAPLPQGYANVNVWSRRFAEINNYEEYLVHNGIHVVKFFLHVSKEEQKRRFIERIDRPEKNWKLSSADARERRFWDQYMDAYEDMFNHTSTLHAPWYIVPADHKWFTRAVVSDIIIKKLETLDLKYPEVDDAHRQELERVKKDLDDE